VETENGRRRRLLEEKMRQQGGRTSGTTLLLISAHTKGKEWSGWTGTRSGAHEGQKGGRDGLVRSRVPR
jgi:hypothetical protein